MGCEQNKIFEAILEIIIVAFQHFWMKQPIYFKGSSIDVSDVYPVSVSSAENTRAKSDVFAAQNNLPKFEYVLHPRSTGFTFIVDRLRKGQVRSTKVAGDIMKYYIKQETGPFVIKVLY